MKRVLAAAAMLGLLAAPAFAQKAKDDDPVMLVKKAKEKDRENTDRQYKAAVQNTRGEKAPRQDPWADMRASTDGAKPEAKR